MQEIENLSSIESASSSLELRSDDVQDFIDRRPHLFIRRGTSLFFLILILLFSVTWFIQYPDVVVARARLSASNAPKEVITNIDGKLVALLVEDGDSVAVGTRLAYLESLASPQSVDEVKTKVDSVLFLINVGEMAKIISFFPDYAKESYLNELGELQQPFQTFIQSFLSFKEYIGNGFYLRKSNMLITDLWNMDRLHAILLEQKQLLLKDVALSRQSFDANESLATDNVISPLDYRNEQSKYIAKQLTLPQLKAAIISNESQQNEKKKEIAELENQITVQKNLFLQSLQTFLINIKEWQLKYILKSSIAGNVVYSGFLQQNQYVRAGQTIFSIHPDNPSIYAELLIPQYNFGKVKAGQRVQLKLLAYPAQEYGNIEGTIENISTNSTDSGYLAKVILPNGLLTTNDKKLEYRYGLYAEANIITNDLRLLERFYYNLRRQTSR
jgi:multidrug efflux pump subunit AcrA (membrane-fusion protein)